MLLKLENEFGENRNGYKALQGFLSWDYQVFQECLGCVFEGLQKTVCHNHN